MALSDKQNKYLATAFLCFEVEPKINFEKFALINGLASANSGRELFRVTKKKLTAEHAEAVAAADAGLPATPASAAPSAKKCKATPAQGTPTPKRARAKATPKGKKAKAEEAEEENGHEVDGEDEAQATARKKSKVKAEVAGEEDDFVL